MMYGLLLDNGHTLRLPSARTLQVARAMLAQHNANHRAYKARGEIAYPRIAVGLVKPKPKNKAARYMGVKGGHARAAALTPQRRSEIARKAARTRWKKEPTP